MHGLGDNLHERAIVRELMREHEVWLKTSWPQIFWDMPQLHLLPLKSPLAWMAKNEIRTAALYGRDPAPIGSRIVSNGYLSRMRPGNRVSVLQTMADVCGVPLGAGDFRLPIAPEWTAKADALLARLNPSKPLMIYRPLIALRGLNRESARAKLARNPDFAAYHALVSRIRHRSFVVSLADLNDGVEELVGPQIEPDVAYHNGELDLETMAALTAKAELVFASPCFLTVLAQAVSAPLVCIFGGFEGKESFSAGARYSPWLPIEPINPCACWSPACSHDKTIDLPIAHARIAQFIAEHHNGNPAHPEKARDAVTPG
jgi:ADP-heptose:LPS heptosyltransferase